MPSISVGQADNLLTAGSVSLPTYTNGSLSRSQYPCSFTPPNIHSRPVPIPLGSYDPKNQPFQHYEGSIPSGMFTPLYKDDPLMYSMPNEEEILSKEDSKENIVSQENYEENSQHKNAGEFSDLTILIFTGVLLLILIFCTYLSFKM